MARWLDGRVTAVIGTHTHVQTNDARVQPGGTAAITDAGMTGPHDSVIGVARAGDPPHAYRSPGPLRAGRRRRPDRGRAGRCDADGRATAFEPVRVRSVRLGQHERMPRAVQAVTNRTGRGAGRAGRRARDREQHEPRRRPRRSRASPSSGTGTTAASARARRRERRGAEAAPAARRAGPAARARSETAARALCRTRRRRRPRRPRSGRAAPASPGRAQTQIHDEHGQLDDRVRTPHAVPESPPRFCEPWPAAHLDVEPDQRRSERARSRGSRSGAGARAGARRCARRLRARRRGTGGSERHDPASRPRQPSASRRPRRRQTYSRRASGNEHAG